MNMIQINVNPYISDYFKKEKKIINDKMKGNETEKKGRNILRKKNVNTYEK